MAVVLKVLPDGRLGTEIADARGECFDYALTLANAPPGCWGCTLCRCDTEATYTVTQDERGQWSCQCKDFQFRFRKHRGREAGTPCKHVLVALEFHKTQQLLTQKVSVP